MRLCYSGRSGPSARAIASVSDEIEAVRSSRGDINWGKRVANTILNSDISNVTNKRHMRELFATNEVPMPKLLTVSEARAFVESGGVVVGRPDSHTKGRGFWQCRSIHDLNKALRGTRRKRAATHFMEYIDKGRAPREYRVHIFKGQSIRISEKCFNYELMGGYRVKVSCYTTAKPQHRVYHIRKAAKKAVASVGLDFGAVDIIGDEENCWVLEVNAAPGLGGSMPILYARTFEEWENGDWDE